jgi:polyisoprenoid-binding protein YceI
MRRQILLGCVLPLSLGLASTPAGLDVQPESRLWVSGTSTVRSFECRATSFDANVETLVTGATAAVLDGQKGVGVVDITVAIDRLECGNGKMNSHMRKALKAAEHPQIKFHLESYDLSRAVDTLQVTLNGSLTMGGVAKPTTLMATARAEGTGLRVAGTHELLLTEFGLKPPSLMLGTMKVGDKVNVGFDIVLKDRTE